MANQTTTLDSLMTDFVCDMVVADDELSDSIWSCVDNFIDDLCLRVMEDESSVFETDRDDPDTPFNYIVDKVLERIDTIEDISSGSYMQAMAKSLVPKEQDEHYNTMDPDYCEDVNFDEINAEDFQLYISVPNVDEEAEEGGAWGAEGTGVDSRYDSIFNA